MLAKDLGDTKRRWPRRLNKSWRYWLPAVLVLSSILSAIINVASPTPASAAPTYVQSATNNASASATTIAKVFAGANTAGNMIIASFSWTVNSSTSFSCSDSVGNTYTNVVNVRDVTQTDALGICYAKNIASGTATVTVTFGASATNRNLVVAEYSGVSTVSPVDAVANSNGVSTTTTDAVTTDTAKTTVSGALIFGAVENSSGSATSTVTAGTGFTQRTNANSQLYIQDKTQSSPGAVSSTQTFGTTAKRYIAGMVAMSPSGISGSGGGRNPTPRYIQSDATTGATATTSIAQAFTVPNTAGNAIVLTTSWDITNTTTFTCSDSNNNTYAYSFKASDTTTTDDTGVCYALNIAGGANTVTVTYGSTASSRRISITEYTGVAVSNALDGATSQNSTSTTTTDAVTSTSITTTTPGDLIYGVVFNTSGGGSSITNGTNFTGRAFPSALDQYNEDWVQATPGSVAATFTFGTSSKRYLAGVIAFKPYSATPAFVQGASGGNNASATTIAQAFTNNNNAGNLIVAYVAWTNGTSTTFTCTDSKSNTYTNAVVKNDSTNSRSIGICYAPNIGAGANTVTVTFGATSTNRRINIAEYSGLDTSNPLDVTASNQVASSSSSTDGITSTTSTPTYNYSLVTGAMDFTTTAATTLAAGTNYTQRSNSFANLEFSAEDQVLAASKSIAATFTGSPASKPYVAVMAVFKVPTVYATPSFAQKVQSAPAGSASTIPATLSSNTVVGDLLVATFTWADAGGTEAYSCADSSSNTYVVGPQTRVSADGQSTGTCYAKVTTAGSSTVTVTLPGSRNFRAIVVSEYTGVNSATPDVTATSTGVSTTTANAVTSTAATTTTNKELIVGAVMNSTAGTNTVTAGTNFTARGDVTVNSVAHAFTTEDFSPANAGSQAATFTFSNASKNYAAIMLAFKPSTLQRPAYLQNASNLDESGTGHTTMSATLTNNTTVGDTLVVVFGFDSSSFTTATCSDNKSNAYSTAIVANKVGDQAAAECYARVTTAGATTVTVTWGGNVSFVSILVHEYSGVAAANTVDGSSTNVAMHAAGPNNVSAGTTTTSQDNDLLVSAYGDSTGGAPTVTAGTSGAIFTNRTNIDSGNITAQDAVQMIAGTGTGANETWSGSGDNYEAVMYALRAAPVDYVSNTAPTTPSSLAQYKSDGSTTLNTGDWNNSTTVVLKGTVADPDTSDTDSLCIEVDTVATAFSNTDDSCSSLVTQGTTATVTVSGLSNGTSYHWQARTKDASGLYSSWSSYGGNSDTITAATDFGIDTTAPSSPTTLGQFKSNGTTAIPGTTLYNFDSTLQGWATYANGASVNQSGAQMRSGAGSLALSVPNDPANFYGASITDNVTSTRDLSSGGPVISAWVYQPAGTNGTNWLGQIGITDSSNTIHWGSQVYLTSGKWTYVSYVVPRDVLSSMKAIGMWIANDNEDATSANTIYVDDVQQGNGIWTNESSVVLKGTVSDTASNVALCTEVKAVGSAFTNTEDSCTSYGASGSTASATISSLTTNTKYHWQVRAKDQAGNYSSWVAFGGNNDTVTADPDFGVDTTTPSSGSVYDGTTAGIDANYNDGSLSSLSANWSGFSDSGGSTLLYYTYSIGTTAGGTDILSAQSTTSTSFTATSLSLHTGQIYYVNVQGVDGAGNTTSVISSNGQYVAPSLTFSLSGNSLDLGHMSAGNSYTATGSVNTTVSTNAYSGYVVRQWSATPLTAGSNSISAFSGTYASPATWTGTGFGYTSSDTSIQASGNLFSTGTKYAALAGSTPGDIVADHTPSVSGIPITNEAFTLSYKVVSSGTQAAGTYSTSITLSAQAYF